MKQRCFGNKPGQEFYAQYHDEEWGIPVHDDQKLFEMLILEGAQAGLSWETILKRRNGYRQAFHNFDVIKVATMSDHELEILRSNENIIRNKLKIYSTRTNAEIFIQIQEEFGSFDTYLWKFVNGTPIKNRWQDLTQQPVRSLESDALAKDLQKRGMKFVGSTIMYAYMQAVGLINDHYVTCWLYHENN
jgi:DNA-3-methyladenine glycosylase I